MANLVIVAGLKNIELISAPPALTPAKALPWALGLCSRSWKPEAEATGAIPPASRSVRMAEREEIVMGGSLRDMPPGTPGMNAIS